jgi:hypothetical protein
LSTAILKHTEDFYKENEWIHFLVHRRWGKWEYKANDASVGKNESADRQDKLTVK